MTDFNTNSLNRPEYYDKRSSGGEIQEQVPGGDYGPPRERAARPAQDVRRPMPESLKGIFKPRKKHIALRVLAAALAVAVVLGAAGTGMLIERKNNTAANGNTVPDSDGQYTIYEPLPKEVERYVTPEDEAVTLNIEDIDRSGEELALNEIYEKCIPSVVDITAVNNDSGSLGTGIVMDERGFILTNAHIVEEALRIYVTLTNERTYEAMLVGMDSDMDVAVLKIDAPELTAAHFGDSDQLMIGENVAVIGDPTIYTELRGTLTNGIVSALNRPMDMAVRLIQTNAAINTGNSGGPVINAYGQVIGITVMKMTSSQKNIEGLGFAIPVSAVKTVVEEIIRKGEYEHPAIGIVGMTVSAELSAAYDTPRGVLVDSVLDAAAEGGCELLPGDVITTIDGREILNMDALNDMKYRHSIGDVMRVTVVRAGVVKNVDVPLFSDSILDNK